MAQWAGHCPANQKVTGFVAHQGTSLGLRPGPRKGVCERQPIDFSLAYPYFSPSLFPSLPLSLKLNKIFKKYIKLFVTFTFYLLREIVKVMLIKTGERSSPINVHSEWFPESQYYADVLLFKSFCL